MKTTEEISIVDRIHAKYNDRILKAAKELMSWRKVKHYQTHIDSCLEYLMESQYIDESHPETRKDEAVLHLQLKNFLTELQIVEELIANERQANGLPNGLKEI